MKISVITPVYNAEKYITQAVESALQFPEIWEIILVEDQSPDNALEVCENLAEKYASVAGTSSAIGLGGLGYAALKEGQNPISVYNTINPLTGNKLGYDAYTLMGKNTFKKFVSKKLKFDAIHLPADKTMIEKVGFCTGGAQDFIVKAAEQGCDAYISGEVSERTFYEAKELGVHYFACGHHATERYGVQRLGQAISEQFDIEYVYFELNNPV